MNILNEYYDNASQGFAQKKKNASQG